MQRVKNEFEKDAMIPKMAVKKSVALKAVLRPMRSEPLYEAELNAEFMRIKIGLHVPQPTAPIIIPANIEDEIAPI